MSAPKKRFILSTRTSLHKAVELEIDGKLYKSNMFTKQVYDVIKENEPKARMGDSNALFAQIKAIFPVEDKVLNKLDLRDVQDMIDWAHSAMMGETEDEEEKKVSKGGDASSPSSQKHSQPST